jgi:hypothetical protein
MENKTEVWLRGPVNGVPPVLQPVAHALLQANDEIQTMMMDFPQNKLWEQPAGVASVAFHLRHIPGVLDRLFAYSKGLPISNAQLKYLSEEELEDLSIKKDTLLMKLSDKINESVEYLKSVDPASILEERTVGRKKLLSTVLGLLFHAAEHTMRHIAGYCTIADV